jgi:hypothetical protein
MKRTFTMIPNERSVADRLGDITAFLEKAVADGDLGAIVNGVAELGQLRMALESDSKVRLSAEEFLAELRKVSESPVRPPYEEKDVVACGRKRLFRRQAWYRELWCFNQVVVASEQQEAEESETIAFQEKEGECESGEFEGVGDSEEISPDDLDDAEARAVAEDLATEAEDEPLKVMGIHEIRKWIKRKLEEE